MLKHTLTICVVFVLAVLVDAVCRAYFPGLETVVQVHWRNVVVFLCVFFSLNAFTHLTK